METKLSALIALAVYATHEVVKVSLNRFGPEGPLAGDIATAAFFWAIPLLIVYLVERKTVASLGFLLQRKHFLFTAACAVVCLLVPLFFVPLDRGLLIEFVEQIAYIGLAEEVFYRGYLANRLCSWRGKLQGLVVASALFGLSHVVSLVSYHGLARPLQDAFVGLYTGLAGLLYGFLLLRTRSIVPGAIIHVGMNAFLSRLLPI